MRPGDSLEVFRDTRLELRTATLMAARFGAPKQVLSDAAWNGGWMPSALAVANHQMRPAAVTSQAEFDAYCRTVLAEAGLPPCAALQLTAAALPRGEWVQDAQRAPRLTVCVSAGVRGNAVAAGDPASYQEDGEGGYLALPVGTLNVMVFLDAAVAPAACAHVFTVVAEAKAAVLAARRVPSRYSGAIATGTGTDSTIVASDPAAVLCFNTTSTHSALGSRIADALRTALAAALDREPAADEAPA